MSHSAFQIPFGDDTDIQAVGTSTSSAGNAPYAAAADHVHALAAATTSVQGAMSAADKTKLDFKGTKTTTITAHAGGGQSSAVALTTQLNILTTVGTTADSVKLPLVATNNDYMVVRNAGANSANVFPASGEALNALSADTALAVAAGGVAIFFPGAAGKWFSLVGA